MVRRALALLVFAFVPSPALACVPAPPGPDEPRTLEEGLRRTADRTTHIVYAVVERAIAEGRERSRGRVRILHVYKGDMRAGQRVAMFYAWRTVCPAPRPDPIPRISRGGHGVLLIDGGPEPLEFNHFMSQDNVDAMIRFGIIESARLPRP